MFALAKCHRGFRVPSYEVILRTHPTHLSRAYHDRACATTESEEMGDAALDADLAALDLEGDVAKSPDGVGRQG